MLSKQSVTRLHRARKDMDAIHALEARAYSLLQKSLHAVYSSQQTIWRSRERVRRKCTQRDLRPAQ